MQRFNSMNNAGLPPKCKQSFASQKTSIANNDQQSPGLEKIVTLDYSNLSSFKSKAKVIKLNKEKGNKQNARSEDLRDQQCKDDSISSDEIEKCYKSLVREEELFLSDTYSNKENFLLSGARFK